MHIAILGAAAVLSLPTNVHNLRVYDHGHKLLALSDPAPDTCSKQVSYVKSRRDLRVIAAYVGCWHEVENFTARRVKVTWR